MYPTDSAANAGKKKKYPMAPKIGCGSYRMSKKNPLFCIVLVFSTVSQVLNVPIFWQMFIG